MVMGGTSYGDEKGLVGAGLMGRDRSGEQMPKLRRSGGTQNRTYERIILSNLELSFKEIDTKIAHLSELCHF
jgi:hypothetical protein